MDKATQKRLVHKFEELALDPRPGGVEKIKSHPDFYRLRIGNFRVIYNVRNNRDIIILLVKDRKDAYKNLGDLESMLTQVVQKEQLDEKVIQLRVSNN